MKVNEVVIKEERIDELAPIVVGGMAISMGAIIAAISAAFLVWTAYDIWQLLKRNDFIEDGWDLRKQLENLGDIPEEDWYFIGILIGFAAAPWARKPGKWLLDKILPDSWKTKIAQFTKEQFMKKFKKVKAEDLTKAKDTPPPPVKLPPAAEKTSKAIGAASGAGYAGTHKFDDVVDNLSP